MGLAGLAWLMTSPSKFLVPVLRFLSFGREGELKSVLGWRVVVLFKDEEFVKLCLFVVLRFTVPFRFSSLPEVELFPASSCSLLCWEVSLGDIRKIVKKIIL